MSRRTRSENLYTSDNYVDPDTLDANKQPVNTNIVYNTNKNRKPTRHLSFVASREFIKNNAVLPVKLVPITLDLEIDNMKIKDSFTWNLNDTLLTPEQFATILAEDIDSPVAVTLIPQIAQSIRQQLQSYAGAVVEDGVETGDVEKEQEEYEGVDDLRVVIKLDIHCGPLHLKDRFEWPLLKTHSITPEDFAKQLTAELGIGGEFVSLIAHSIREQVCYARLNFDETMAAPSWATMAHPPFRNENDESFWEPELKELDSEELEKIRKEQERNARRMRRAARTGPNTRSGVAPAQSNQHHQQPLMQQQPMQQFQQNGQQPMMFAPNMFNMPGMNNFPMMFNGMNMGMNPMAGLMNLQNMGNMSWRPNQRLNTIINQQNGNTSKIPYLKYQPRPEEMVAQRNAIDMTTFLKPKARKVDPQESSELLSKQLNMLTKAEAAAAPGPAANTAIPIDDPFGLSPAKRHRGFGASAKPFNEDGSMEVGEFRKNWRCTWCLLSGKYTPTLRKGPMGGKTLCNACGIWYTKHGSLPQDRFREHEHTVITKV